MAELSWLESTPTDARDSLAAGLKLGMDFRDTSQRLQMAHQKIASDERATALDAQVRREQIMSNFQRAVTQTALTKAYHDSQLGLQKSRLALENQKLIQSTQEKAKILADRQGYANAVAGG